MEQLFDFLSRHPFAALVVFIWLMGVLSQVLGRAARKAKNVKERARKPESLGPVGAESMSTQTSRSAPQQAQPSADEIAEEIRRVMGLETEDERRQDTRTGPATATAADEDWEDWDEWKEEDEDEDDWVQPAAEPQRPATTFDRGPHHQKTVVPSGSLHERMRLKDREVVHLGKIEDRRLQSVVGGNVAARHLPSHVGTLSHVESKRGGRRARRVRRRVDLSDPAAAFVMIEVLGPPKAMRPDQED